MSSDDVLARLRKVAGGPLWQEAISTIEERDAAIATLANQLDALRAAYSHSLRCPVCAEDPLDCHEGDLLHAAARECGAIE
jgi:hypothetical protein